MKINVSKLLIQLIYKSSNNFTTHIALINKVHCIY
uniref:Uncharacterized protein n=1 Tax=Lepeophtheirus salmonis TaxID=72036 RepID=A0A0K2VDB2_LEPSM